MRSSFGSLHLCVYSPRVRSTASVSCALLALSACGSAMTAAGTYPSQGLPDHRSYPPRLGTRGLRTCRGPPRHCAFPCRWRGRGSLHLRSLRRPRPRILAPEPQLRRPGTFPRSRARTVQSVWRYHPGRPCLLPWQRRQRARSCSTVSTCPARTSPGRCLACPMRPAPSSPTPRGRRCWYLKSYRFWSSPGSGVHWGCRPWRHDLPRLHPPRRPRRPRHTDRQYAHRGL